MESIYNGSRTNAATEASYDHTVFTSLVYVVSGRNKLRITDDSDAHNPLILFANWKVKERLTTVGA